MEIDKQLEYGYCPLAIIPLRATADDRSEMISQVLFGEHFTVLKKETNWIYIQLAADSYKGWVGSKQWATVSENEYNDFISAPKLYVTGLMQKITLLTGDFYLPMGAVFYSKNRALFSGNTFYPNLKDKNIGSLVFEKEKFLSIVKQFLNTPYLWGGKSFFGIDCSGFTQVVYSLFGISLLRDAKLQATQGELVPFLEQASLGDLAFFENKEGLIVHVGIMLSKNKIIHAHGKVRIDAIDQEGIFDEQQQKYTHKLRFINRYF